MSEVFLDTNMYTSTVELMNLQMWKSNAES